MKLKRILVNKNVMKQNNHLEFSCKAKFNKILCQY